MASTTYYDPNVFYRRPLPDPHVEGLRRVATHWLRNHQSLEDAQSLTQSVRDILRGVPNFVIEPSPGNRHSVIIEAVVLTEGHQDKQLWLTFQPRRLPECAICMFGGIRPPPGHPVRYIFLGSVIITDTNYFNFTMPLRSGQVDASQTASKTFGAHVYSTLLSAVEPSPRPSHCFYIEGRLEALTFTESRKKVTRFVRDLWVKPPPGLWELPYNIGWHLDLEINS